MAGVARAMGVTLTGCKTCLAKIKIFMYSFLNLDFAPHARDRDVTRLDGARDNKQVWRAYV